MNGYWDTLAKLWGPTTAGLAYWLFTAFYVTILLVGTGILVFKTLSIAFTEMKEHDKSFKEALGGAAREMLKWIILLAISAIIIPIMWEVVIPVIINYANLDTTVITASANLGLGGKL